MLGSAAVTGHSLVLIFSVLAGSSEAPRLELEEPAGAPFATGDMVRVPIYLRADPVQFKYISFGIEGEEGSEISFAFALDLVGLPGVSYYADRIIDSRRVAVGIGNFDFNDPRLVLEVTGGRLLLGGILVKVLKGGPWPAELLVRAGECACVEPGTVTDPVLHLGPGGKVEPAGAAIELLLGDRDFIRGDATEDGKLDIADPLRILEDLFWSGRGIHCPDRYDANDDGAVDVSDPIRLLDHLFLGGPRPPAPYPASGPDPTPDGLNCRARPW